MIPTAVRKDGGEETGEIKREGKRERERTNWMSKQTVTIAKREDAEDKKKHKNIRKELNKEFQRSVRRDEK